MIRNYNKAAFDDPNREWKDTEAQFQLSIKFPLLVNLFNDTFDVYEAYTNRSFWQMYDGDSAPFRETDHEPEIWVQFHPNWEFYGFKNTWNSIGLNWYWLFIDRLAVAILRAVKFQPF